MKRRIFKLGLFLLLLSGGAIINIAVAWGCVLSLPPMFEIPMNEVTDSSRVIPQEEVVELLRNHFHDSGIRMRPGEEQLIGGWGEEQQRLGWKTIEASLTDHDLMFLLETRLAGWPSYSFEGWFDSDNRRIEEDYRRRYGVLLLPEWAMPQQGVRRLIDFLPWHPIWPGFAINTIFYAAIVWMLFAAPFQFRRRRRIKRGLCPACAYPVGAAMSAPSAVSQ